MFWFRAPHGSESLVVNESERLVAPWDERPGRERPIREWLLRRRE
jgi:hypothetical protein